MEAYLDHSVQSYERAQWVSVDALPDEHAGDISSQLVVDIGLHFAVISLAGDVHHATNLSRLRGKWTAVLADTGEPAFITHIRKAPMSLREIEELSDGKT